MMDAAARRRLAGALAKLPRRQRQAFLAAAICGLSNAQIAMRLRTDMATVETLLAAALVALDDAIR